MRPIDTWARGIDDPGKLPKIFRDRLPGDSAEPFPYTIYAPTDRWGYRKAHPKVLQVLPGGLRFLELGRAGVAERFFPYAGITCLEMGRILLHAWIKVSGVCGGDNASVMVEFNSVVEDLFRPAARAIRVAAAGIPPAGEETLRLEWRKLEFLSKLSFKYANFARISLLPGERLAGAVYEPDIRRRGLLGLRTVEPAHLVLLTDRELITINDDRHRDVHQTYGGIWRYFPLGKIEELAVAEDSAGHNALEARLADGTRLGHRFSAENREETQRLQRVFAAQRTGQAG